LKRLALLVLVCLFLFGCGQMAREAEFWDHNSVYKTGSHFWFSAFGYSSCDDSCVQLSKEEGWWGQTVPCSGATSAAPVKQVVERKKPEAAASVIAPADIEKKKAEPAKKEKKKKSKKKSKSKKKKKPVVKDQ
jgi:hypothetical protein